jgi:mannose-1-phosphate guanylyltransferase
VRLRGLDGRVRAAVARDSDARIVLLPADHYVRDEAILALALRRAAACAARNRDGVYLLGIEPHELDTELGYIVPQYGSSQQPSRVTEFVEKPSLDRVLALVKRGALWNAFIVAASARALLALYGRCFVSTLTDMRLAVERRHRSPDHGVEMADLYQHLPTLDFSRDVLEGQEDRLSVLRVPSCGWTDLGTPQRVAQTLMRLPRTSDPAGRISAAALGLDLAAQHWRLTLSGNRAPLGRSI